MYKGGAFTFSFVINMNYPHDPPKVKCTHKVSLPRVYIHHLIDNPCCRFIIPMWTLRATSVWTSFEKTGSRSLTWIRWWLGCNIFSWNRMQMTLSTKVCATFYYIFVNKTFNCLSKMLPKRWARTGINSCQTFEYLCAEAASAESTMTKWHHESGFSSSSFSCCDFIHTLLHLHIQPLPSWHYIHSCITYLLTHSCTRLGVRVIGLGP